MQTNKQQQEIEKNTKAILI